MSDINYMEVQPGGHCFKCHMTYYKGSNLEHQLEGVCGWRDFEPTPGECSYCRPIVEKWNEEIIKSTPFSSNGRT